MSTSILTILALVGISMAAENQYPNYSATYVPAGAQASQGGNLPDITETPYQYGTNNCTQWGSSSQESLCQNVFINSIDDFCIWGPPFSDGQNGTIANTERFEVSWCTKAGYGTRLVPDGTFSSIHFLETPEYFQITGTGDFTKIGIPATDEGGELDPHGDDSNGNPEGGLVFSNQTGTWIQAHEWTNFISANQYCFRICKDGASAPGLCNHVYDVLGCDWNIPANYTEGIFESCDADNDIPMGVYGTSTFSQGEPVTPSANPAASSSNCVFQTSIPSNGQLEACYGNATCPSSTSAPSATPTGTAKITSASGSGTKATSGGSSTGSSSSPAATKSSSSSAQGLRVGMSLIGAAAVLGGMVVIL